jgi:predicted extracellular nuclease
VSPLVHNRLRRAALAAIPALALIGSGLAVAAPAAAVDTASNVVITEVYGGGGNSGAPFNKDFVELYNRASTPVDLTGWSVQYSSAAGTTWQSTALAGSIAAGSFYEISESGGATGADLPTPDVVGTLALSAASGKVALVSGSAAALTCGATCSSATGVTDFVGYGTANDSAGAPTPALSNTSSAQRVTSPLADAGNNHADFVRRPQRLRPLAGLTAAPPRFRRRVSQARRRFRMCRVMDSSPPSSARPSRRSPVLLLP